MKLLKYLTAFTAGGIAVALIVGAVLAIDGSSGDDNSDTVAVATASPGDGTEVAATDGECLSAADIYETVRPSVVEISVSVSQSTPFGQQQTQGTGSGVIIDDEGHILTNNHVVGDATSIQILFDDGDTASATLLGTDPENDLAVIQVDPTEHDLVPADLGDSDDLRVGDVALALGTPFNLGGTLTQGIVSALDRTYSGGGTTRPIRHMIQTDAAVNPGNSGGPLLNCQGEVIGINTLLENPTGDSVNVGVAFAVSINTATNELDSLIGSETITHTWLGIGGADITPALADDLDLSVDEGVYITVVSPDSPADAASLVPAFASEQAAAASADLAPGGDVIIAADGQDMTSIDELATYLDTNKDPGDTVELTVVRDGEEVTVEATLADWPS
ncbi:MAG: trypsin-like peptidase domain-containing protein [Dehalococcoidia bacterium]